MEENVTVQENKRPGFLTVLCILTFIGSGLNLLFSIIALVAVGAIGGLLSSIPGASALAGGGIGMKILWVLLYFGSLYGAIMMWKLKKTGFYLYVVAQIIILILPLFTSIFGIGSFLIGFIFTAAFIIMYGVNLKYMK